VTVLCLAARMSEATGVWNLTWLPKVES